jgi:hypothetical protein
VLVCRRWDWCESEDLRGNVVVVFSGVSGFLRGYWSSGSVAYSVSTSCFSLTNVVFLTLIPQNVKYVATPTHPSDSQEVLFFPSYYAGLMTNIVSLCIDPVEC